VFPRDHALGPGARAAGGPVHTSEILSESFSSVRSDLKKRLRERTISFRFFPKIGQIIGVYQRLISEDLKTGAKNNLNRAKEACQEPVNPR
jgi:hypothetical protein